MTEEQGNIIIYQTDDNHQLRVKIEGQTVWLSQVQLAELYQTTKSNISEHIAHIYEEKELSKEATVRKFRTVQKEGSRDVARDIEHYNLDMIISLGYRVKSKIATAFRIWATERIKEYIIKGFTMDDNRLKQAGGGNYWKELLNRIRDIRSSEKVLYRQVLDLYATSRDYDPKSPETLKFFKIVQNKLHYAAHGQTAAEVIFNRANANKPFMGLTTFEGSLPTKAEAKIAKNYLTAKELDILNKIVSGYFDFAEVYATRHEHLYMADYIKQLDKLLVANGEQILESAGSISHKQAMDKVEQEYKKYQVQTLTPIEKEYLQSLKELENKVKKSKKQK